MSTITHKTTTNIYPELEVIQDMHANEYRETTGGFGFFSWISRIFNPPRAAHPASIRIQHLSGISSNGKLVSNNAAQLTKMGKLVQNGGGA